MKIREPLLRLMCYTRPHLIETIVREFHPSKLQFTPLWTRGRTQILSSCNCPENDADNVGRHIFDMYPVTVSLDVTMGSPLYCRCIRNAWQT